MPVRKDGVRGVRGWGVVGVGMWVDGREGVRWKEEEEMSECVCVCVSETEEEALHCALTSAS